MQVTMEYIPSWPLDFDYQNILDKQSNVLEKEKILQHTLSGPHRDSIKVLLNNRDFKTVGSTGQIRIISLILKALQAKYFYEIHQKPMVYLFDDVLLELDTEKQISFLKSLPQTKQSFLYLFTRRTLA